MDSAPGRPVRTALGEEKQMQKHHSADLSEDEISTYFASDYVPGFGHANRVADLVLTNYGAGYAWLRSEEPSEAEDALYVPTQRGRDQVARQGDLVVHKSS